MRVLHYSFADEFRSETEGFHGFVVLLEIDLFKIFMGFFGTSCTIIIDFSHDDQHIEDHANRISKLRFFLPLFSNKPTYLLISKPFKNFIDKSLFNIVFSELIALVELFDPKSSTNAISSENTMLNKDLSIKFLKGLEIRR